MEGFKKSPKIACFKEGGQVGYKSRKEHSESKEMSSDIKQDKKIVKKAFSIHDAQQHEEKTDLSKLKKGGRAKKENGSVRKYSTGRGVAPEQSAAYKERVTKDIDTSKKIVAGELPAQSTPGVMTPAERRASIAKAFGPRFKKGGNVKKMAGGRSTGELPQDLTDRIAKEENTADAAIIPRAAKGALDAVKGAGKRLYENVMGTDKQNAEAQARMDAAKAVAKKRGGKC